MKILRKILMVMIMVAMVVTSTSFAAGDYSITVTVDKKLGEARGDISLWKVSGKQVPYDNKSSKLDELNKLSIEELNSKYSNPTVLEFNDNQIVFDKLSAGAYYMRDTSGIKRDKDIVPVLINLPDDVENDSKNVTIHAKESSTNVRLVKVDESGNPLKGAKFKLLKREGREYVELKNKATLKKDGKLELSPKDDGRSKVKSEENAEKSKDESSKSEDKDEKSKDKAKSDEGLYISNEFGEIIINDIKKGDYIFREVEAPEGYLIKNVDTRFTITDKSVELRVVNSKTPDKDKGRHDFMKTDEAKKPLGGAMFKVMTKNKDGKFEPVKKDGKDYIVTSADNGKFSVEDMDYGKYYLVEIKAPQGFILLSEPVEFEIKKQADDKTISIAFITNKSDTITRTPDGDITRGGKMPKTGDIRFFMSMIGGAIMFFIGKWIIAKDDKLIGKNIK
ncbi:collagen binding domain-containing protein [Finegoldia magna]|nr:SpaA isopeptide-forming pilin-related protein [Finegoldia magna]MDU1010846.1 SpaA isopeptide-forming pilin-related protein [Finegoldia magna]MDU1086640.1 SpaA isopeptide-forming pilin-related protein [Finegoldia magna]MDU1878260.1 SpaA isopeptide-forming pilin-related protein [Finegoldia magna]MDU4278311.1 SpaA isopeptide-forming pilin-related protein [Finegoldia magna]MDU5201128.1 SpaA isopeptide-forming pilin-related protein [Finegoldia magna]